MNLKILSIAILNLQKEINVGTIIRTANAGAIYEILIVGRKKWNKSATTGIHKRTKITYLKTKEEMIEYAEKNYYEIISLEINKKSKNIFDYEYPERSLLVIGNEGDGVCNMILNKSKDILRIPQYGEVECLNAGISASIAIYDWVRKEQKNKEKKYDNKFLSFEP